MKIRRQHIGMLMALGALGAVSGAGCADNRASIFIRGAMLIPPDTCSVQADTSSPMLAEGFYDLAFSAISGEYTAALLVGNQLVARGDSATLRAETSRVQFYEAEVNLTTSGGSAIANGNFVVPITGFADPAGTSAPGYGIAFVTLIDGTSTQSLQPGQLVANVILRGETLGGVDVETDEWSFPISVCQGCLVTFPPEADDPALPGRDCTIVDEAPTYCRPGSDTFVDCRACQGIIPECGQ